MRKILLLGFLLLINVAIALPPIAQEFYGVVLFSGSPAPPLTKIEAFYIEQLNFTEQLCGSFSTVEPGKYGLLSCNGDDPATPDVEGAYEGQIITFKITTFNASVPNGTNWTGNISELTFSPVTIDATAYGNTSWNSGEFHQVNLYITYDMWWLLTQNDSNITNVTLPSGFCGDGLCGLGEDCSVCSLDCGVCPPPPPGQGAGGGKQDKTDKEKNRQSTGAGAAPPSIMPEMKCIEAWQCTEFTKCRPEGQKYRTCEDTANCGTELNKPKFNESCCYEIWECGEWSVCSPLGVEERSCIDKNACGTEEYKPNATQSCRYPTCNDGIRNGNEEGVDCGGICLPCKGLEYAKPISAQPATIAVCGNGICNIGEPCGCPSDCRRFPWFILAIAVAVSVAEHYYNKRRWKSIRADIYIRRMERLKKVAKIKRKSFWFKTIVLIASVILSVYIYFFATCPGDFRRYLVILIAGAAATPIIAYLILKRFEYSEEEREIRYELLVETHKEQLKKLIEMENVEIERIEKELSQRISNIDIQGIDPELKLQLSSIAYKLDTLAKYLDKKEDYVDVEGQIASEIEKLKEQENYKKLAENESFKYIDTRLNLLLAHHKEKEELIRNVRKDESEIKAREEEIDHSGAKEKIKGAYAELAAKPPQVDGGRGEEVAAEQEKRPAAERKEENAPIKNP